MFFNTFLLTITMYAIDIGIYTEFLLHKKVLFKFANIAMSRQINKKCFLERNMEIIKKNSCYWNNFLIPFNSFIQYPTRLVCQLCTLYKIDIFFVTFSWLFFIVVILVDTWFSRVDDIPFLHFYHIGFLFCLNTIF